MSRGDDNSRYLTLGKPGAIIGQVTFRKLLASVLILASQESQVMPSASNVDAVLAAAPLNKIFRTHFTHFFLQNYR